DTGAFSENRYFDVSVEYAKGAPEDILIRVSVTNHGPERAELHLLPTVWFRNTWSRGSENVHRPVLREANGAIRLEHDELGERLLQCDGDPELLFTENETNVQRLFGAP